MWACVYYELIDQNGKSSENKKTIIKKNNASFIAFAFELGLVDQRLIKTSGLGSMVRSLNSVHADANNMENIILDYVRICLA